MIGKSNAPTLACSRTVTPIQSAGQRHAPIEEENTMLWTIFIILLVLWFFGLVTSYTLGGFIHILLVVAVAVLLIQLIAGRRAI
jgi:hypothetical protein